MAEDSELWDLIYDGPHVPMKKLEETGPLVSKGRKEYSDTDKKAVEKNYRTKKILMCSIGPDEYNRVRVQSAQKNIAFTDRVTTSKGPGRECILEKNVKGTFSVNEKEEKFLWHSSGNEHYVNGLKRVQSPI
uniref:Uncharacterized protein LOC104244563 n=1 Tax=Nicotiana sylvestris TaxID=4096 RepID=A0A1U7Y8Q6_NICSY|nr:PREDICTED: uncharacterized protein LOC104244563 [Nicotiana sylvestris]